MDLKNLLNKESALSRDELIYLLGLNNPEEIKMLLFPLQNEKRIEIFGREVHLRGSNRILELLREETAFIAVSEKKTL